MTDRQTRTDEPRVILAESAGYCFGVQRAVDMVEEQVREHGGATTIYTLGPLIHNQQVIDQLAEQGVVTLPDEEALDEVKDGIVIIRSHGVSRAVMEKLEAKGISYVDATCPFVERIHAIVQEEESKGNRVIVVGDPVHPEVRGICGWCRQMPIVIPDAEAAEKMPESNGDSPVISVVAQTTFQKTKFQEIVEILRRKGYNINVLDTVCSATLERQKEAAEIASEVDLMLVIGDVHSSNTQKLFEICNTCCTNTHFVQVPGDLDLNRIMSVKTVGITAGASTPNNIIEEVQNHVRRKDFV